METRSNYYFTSESVSEGHPDKICDIIADGILDQALELDNSSRVACECFASTGLILVGGEITTSGYIDIIRIARDTLKNIGYTDPLDGIDSSSCAVVSTIKPQSPDICRGVTPSKKAHKEQGAGDQGMVFGYACGETPELMPAPLQYAHGIIRKATKVRKEKVLDFLRPDGKCQVTVEYKNSQPYAIDTVVLSLQHREDVDYKILKEELTEKIIKPALPEGLKTNEMKIHINPTGRFVIGGPSGDTGLTGRKIIMDTYGGAARHGGGSFSGKDPSKVDRSGAYMARYIAKNLVAAGAAKKLEVQLAYAIGIHEPVSVYVNTFGTGEIPDDKIEKALPELFSLTPRGIIDTFRLKRPIYKATASSGHFGKAYFPWEKLNKLDDIKVGLL